MPKEMKMTSNEQKFRNARCTRTKSDDGGSCGTQIPCDGEIKNGVMSGGCGKLCDFIMYSEMYEVEKGASVNMPWRNGMSFAIHVYAGNTPVCTAQTEEYGERIVADHNARIDAATWDDESLIVSLAEAISDVHDMDTTMTDYARAAIKMLKKDGLLFADVSGYAQGVRDAARVVNKYIQEIRDDNNVASIGSAIQMELAETIVSEIKKLESVVQIVEKTESEETELWREIANAYEFDYGEARKALFKERAARELAESETKKLRDFLSVAGEGDIVAYRIRKEIP